jgi:hypothetical protein
LVILDGNSENNLAITNGILNREFGTHHDYVSDSILDALKDLII